MKRCCAALLVAISGLALVPAQAPIGGEVGRQLEQLRQKNEALEERVNTLEFAQLEAGSGSGLLAQYDDITATFKIFGDVGLDYRNPEAPGQGHSNFFLGAVDFFANVQMGDHFRILSESVLDARGGERIGVDQERLWAMWTVSDALYVKLGTEHSPVSRWNQLFHHGSWLETSISRPLLAAFEGGGGIVSMHATGIELGGRQQTSAAAVEWFLAVSNGRGPQPANKQRTSDANDGKKIDVGVAVLPTCVPDLRLGTAFTYDEIPPDPTSAVAGRTHAIREFVATAQAQYRNGPFDVLSEFAWIEHHSRGLMSTFHHHSGYAQIGYRAGQVTPFARMDYRQMERMDPYYSAIGRDLDILRPVVGVRYDPSESIAAKLEFAFGKQEEAVGPGASRDRDVLTVAFQVSWVL